MICPYCGNSVALNRKNCDACGFDLEPSRILMMRSNALYNRGLKMAQVRNLTAAVPVLEKSLELYKYNSDARNLLGLIYYETGNIVDALSSWFISRHLVPEDNEADYFLEKARNDKATTDSMNLAVKKFNSALREAQQHNFDLAIIQLKKAISVNSKFIKGYQLLTLIYMVTGEKSKAYKLINSGLKIDIGNTALLRYREELTGSSQDQNGEEYSVEEDRMKDKPIRAKFSYKEEKPSVFPFINLILGVLIGIICAYWLVVPTVKKNMKEEYESSKIDYSSELAAKTASNDQLHKTITDLERKIEELAEGSESSNQNGMISIDSQNFYTFFEVWGKYNDLKGKEYSDEELITLAYMLWSVDGSEITESHASELLSDMRDEIYPLASKLVYQRAKDLFEVQTYEEAVSWFSAAAAMNPDSENPLYYCGRCYQEMGEYALAVENYENALSIAPNSALKSMIEEKIAACKKELS